MSTSSDIPSDVDITNLGLLGDYISEYYGSHAGGCRVDGIRFYVQYMTRQVMVAVYTFRDQLNLNLCYNEAYHSHEQMMEILQTVKECLATGIGHSCLV